MRTIRKAFTPIDFQCGLRMKNRFMVAPMTNTQSHEDGTLGDDELNWLEMRAAGDFGMVMTCASHVQEIGKGFPGQLGIFDDKHIPGHQRITEALHRHDSLAIIQLHHGGLRSPEHLIGEQPVAPSAIEKYNSRELSVEEIGKLRDSFIEAAYRAKKSGYDGVELHGAHGYILCQFLSKTLNLRRDEYGGDLENRMRLLFEIAQGVRKACGDDFLLAIRLSPERFGMDIKEVKHVIDKLIANIKIDLIHISLWDSFKMPEEEEYKELPLLDHFLDIDLKETRLAIAGKITSASEVNAILEKGVDIVGIGRSAILHHDFPKRVYKDAHFTTQKIPVSAEYLSHEGLGQDFIQYMRRWKGFVKD